MKKPDADYLRFRPYRAFTGQATTRKRPDQSAKFGGLILMILSVFGLGVLIFKSFK